MTVYVLVHGAFHGAWCWQKVVPLIEAAGHRAVTLDLPGHGQDRTPLAEVTLDAYCARVQGVIEAEHEPVVLVGHSMGGRVITQVAERIPGRIAAAVYLAAILLRDGEKSKPADPDPEAELIVQAVQPSADGIYQTLRPDLIRETLYADCSDAEYEFALRHLNERQALQPMTVPMRLSAERFGRVRKVYIECLQDRAVTPAQQRRMHTETPCAQVISMDTSHSPFLSAPEELAGHLIAIGGAQPA